MSHDCRISEKNKYWKEFESNRHRFVKILVGDFGEHLRIPRKFIRNFREDLSGTIQLRGPSGFVWTVELVRMFGEAVLLKGWPNFVKEHSLAELDILVFHYDGNSTFNVVIFDSSGCEQEGSYFVKKHTDACKNGRCVLQKEDQEADEVIDLEKLIETNMLKKNINKGRGRPSSIAVDSHHMQKMKINKRRGRPRSRAVDTSHNNCQWNASYVTKKKQPQVEKSALEREEMVVLIDELDESLDSALEVSEDRGNEPVLLKTISDRQEVNDSGKRKKPVYLPGTYGLYFKSSRREITKEEKERPCQLAGQYSSMRPWFSIVMKPSHAFPKSWRDTHVVGNVRVAWLRVPPGKKRWDVRITGSMKGKTFSKGWANFVWENNLEEHDVCIFELNDERNSNRNVISFNVIIFRVLDEIRPLTRVSSSRD